ncbi:hypothetical protein V1511DRAFT_487706 [Dipodascopsis uninucleata]
MFSSETSPSSTPAVGRSKKLSETELREGIDRLNEMLIKLTSLRLATPKLLETLTNGEESPADIYSKFASRSREVLGEIEKFTNAIKRSSDLFDYASKSRAANPQGIERFGQAKISDNDETGTESLTNNGFGIHNNDIDDNKNSFDGSNRFMEDINNDLSDLATDDFVNIGSIKDETDELFSDNALL